MHILKAEGCLSCFRPIWGSVILDPFTFPSAWMRKRSGSRGAMPVSVVNSESDILPPITSVPRLSLPTPRQISQNCTCSLLCCCPVLPSSLDLASCSKLGKQTALLCLSGLLQCEVLNFLWPPANLVLVSILLMSAARRLVHYSHVSMYISDCILSGAETSLAVCLPSAQHRRVLLCHRSSWMLH